MNVLSIANVSFSCMSHESEALWMYNACESLNTCVNRNYNCRMEERTEWKNRMEVKTRMEMVVCNG